MKGHFIVVVLLLFILDNALGVEQCHTITLTDRNASAVFSTPGYPHAYPADASICWVIDVRKVVPIADEKYVVKVEVLDTDLEGSENGIPCQDYGELRDGSHEFSTRLGHWCTVKPWPFYSSRSRARVAFLSDDKGTGSGFSVRVSVAALPSIGSDGAKYSPCKSLSIGTPDLTYILTSPGYPNYYNSYGDVCYVIHLSPNMTDFQDYTVQVTVGHISLEPSDICRYDYISIHDGDSASGYVIRKFCGEENPGQLVSCKRGFYIRFFTDSSNVYRGFSMYYSAVRWTKDICRVPNHLKAYLVAAITVGILMGFVVLFASFFALAAVNKKKTRVHGHNSEIELVSNPYEIAASRRARSDVTGDSYLWHQGAHQDDTLSQRSSSDGEEFTVYNVTKT